MTFRISVLFLLLASLSVDLKAQTGSEAQQNTLLPEINPQDIEIRSEFRARFPGLRRQPILGFNPKPRVFRINPNRMPFMESRDEAVANIAITQLDRPEPPARATLSSPSRTNALLRAGMGNFLTPEANLYLFHSPNKENAVSSNFNFISSEGHTDTPLSSFRNLDGDVLYRRAITDKRRLELGMGFLSDFNRMFDLNPALQNGIGETASKNIQGLSGSVIVHQQQNNVEGWRTEVSGRLFSAEVGAGNTFADGKVIEQIGGISFENTWAGSELYETLGLFGNVNIGNYENGSNSSQAWLITGAGARYKKLFNFNIHLKADVGLSYVSDGVENKFYVAPKVDVRYTLKDALVIKGGIFGSPEMTTMKDHHTSNHFLNAQTVLRQSYTSAAFGEVEFHVMEGTRVFGGASFETTRNYAYYGRQIQSVNGNQTLSFYDVNFGRAQIFEIYGGLTQQVVEELVFFDASLRVRSPKLKSGGDIPFEEKVQAQVSVGYKPIDKLKLSGWGEYIGKRSTASVTQDLSAFLLINAGVEYQFTPKFGVYVKVLNILGQEYEIWEGYEERPLQAFGGITFKL
jgi:hypothetical protein